jgi:hypothetical protein
MERRRSGEDVHSVPYQLFFPCKYLCYIETIITEGKLLDDEKI